jgi:hypothetical protein
MRRRLESLFVIVGCHSSSGGGWLRGSGGRVRTRREGGSRGGRGRNEVVV